ncbi:hypothetical protein AU195_04740 [Mycobacterium sp. IS-1496]|uniref:hypothetical protein n=1 Tax=Mycobacterium sp. IS-1496 TaxID=1772284 RepID=UPI0007414F2E|nr:hypothetical protein [Mycobacterium sp. IS-1496]KUI36161.1 hypothetical protein AU195_04740 [Mycobacterium sp. IS-1496]
MHVSADRLNLSDNAIQRTFEQTCVAWQAIPHWDIGDPGATRVRSDTVNPPGSPTSLKFTDREKPSDLALAQIAAPTPDSMIATAVAAATALATDVDATVITALLTDPIDDLELAGTDPQNIMKTLIAGRAKLEDGGFRAPSCLLTNTKGYQDLSAFSGSYPVTDLVLAAANVNSLHRCSQLDLVAGKAAMVMLGRRQRIAHGAAAEASCGEEPVDLAVRVMPSLEVIGAKAAAEIEAVVRISFATRVTDNTGVVTLHEGP